MMLRERSEARLLRHVSEDRTVGQRYALFWGDICAGLVDGGEVGAEEGERKQLATKDCGVKDESSRECSG